VCVWSQVLRLAAFWGKLIIICGWSLIILRVEHAERRIKYGILFICGPFCEYSNLEYEHAPV